MEKGIKEMTDKELIEENIGYYDSGCFSRKDLIIRSFIEKELYERGYTMILVPKWTKTLEDES